MLKTVVILVGFLVVLGGCAEQSPPRGVWEKAGVADAERKRDEAQCTTASVGTPQPQAALGVLRLDREAFDACMKGKGYSIRPASS